METLRTVLFRMGFIVAMSVLTLIVWVLWSLDMTYGLQAVIPHYDKLLHFLAGMTCGICGIYFLTLRPFQFIFTLGRFNTVVLVAAVTASLLIGSAWEILEWKNPWMYGGPVWNFWDTVFDIIFDVMGSMLAARAYQRAPRKT